jgi:hypothetical protein
MNRQEAILLLKEIMAACESFHYTQAVDIERNKKSGSWALIVYWLPNPSEIKQLEKIVAQHNLEMVSSIGRIIFRSPEN